ncbi:phospholipase D-like domain-containing protein [Streptomyces sp. NBC_00237]|uniref:phospholipase D-like domain-containing protein n=1 Tax=Streptomyces sp. NBC_00237 TaxID=2975687 RepID=UPI00225B5605|nr:phospholipase D-like domain-containing protein [Streptomyces sp. NBC_00237]MCX5200770.1 phospholipase D-like domain-containing protein [Streptomyces sp. NBC_00237]
MQHRRSTRTKKIWMWGTGIGVAALAVPAVAFAGAAPGAEAAVRTTATFNDPAGDTAAQSRIRDHVKGLIEGAKEGSTITAGLYSFTDTQVSGALADARKRGVNVRIVIDNASTGKGGQYDALKTALGTDQSKGSYVTNCGANRGCIGQRELVDGSEDGSINHNKFWLFSETGGTKNVVVQASANMTSLQRTDLFNNAVTIVDAGLYGVYQDYFADLAKRRIDNDYYRTPSAGAYKTYFFPRKEAAGKKWNADASTDTVSLILGNVDCTAGTEVRVAANLFSRREVASKLVSMEAAGCTVRLANDGGTAMSDDVRGILAGKIADRVECAEKRPGKANVGLHSKYVLVNGTYEGKSGRKLVFTGSHNYSYAALRANDETLLKIDDAGLYDQFKENHATIMSYCKGS